MPATNPDTHTPEHIQQVAAGLMRVAHLDAAADTLRRVYGERRATEALVMLSREAGRGQRVDDARHGEGPTATSVRPRATGLSPRRHDHSSHALDTRRPAHPARRRGTRRQDWI